MTNLITSSIHANNFDCMIKWQSCTCLYKTLLWTSELASIAVHRQALPRAGPLEIHIKQQTKLLSNSPGCVWMKHFSYQMEVIKLFLLVPVQIFKTQILPVKIKNTENCNHLYIKFCLVVIQHTYTFWLVPHYQPVKLIECIATQKWYPMHIF